MPTKPPASQNLKKSLLNALAFSSVFALGFLPSPAAAQPPTPKPIIGTLQIKRGSSLSETLLSGQMFMTMPSQMGGMDACDFDLYIGTPYGNRRVIQRFLTGNGAPGSSGTGAILDMYLDKATGLLYQKTAAGWGTPISLKGADGVSPTLSMGTVSTLSAGTSATATLTGTSSARVLNLGLPQGATGAQGSTGATGATPNLTIGTVTPNFTSATPSATITGTAANPVLNLTFSASPYTFMADIPTIALVEINTNKAVTLTFPAAFLGTNYVYFVQFVSTSGGLLNTITYTQGAKTNTSLTLNVKSTVAVAAGSAQAWVIVSYKNAP